MNGKERCLLTIRGRHARSVRRFFPLLMSFAAKRSGLSYREIRLRTVPLWAEAQLAMLERFSLDAITPARTPLGKRRTLGGGFVFPDDTPPYLAKPLFAGTERSAAHQKAGRLKRPLGRMHDRVASGAEMAPGGRRGVPRTWMDRSSFAEAWLGLRSQSSCSCSMNAPGVRAPRSWVSSRRSSSTSRSLS